MMPNVVLRAIADTTLKAMPVREDRLPVSQKKVLEKDRTLLISNYRPTSGHFVFECFEGGFVGKWFIEGDTVEISVKKNA